MIEHIFLKPKTFAKRNEISDEAKPDIQGDGKLFNLVISNNSTIDTPSDLEPNKETPKNSNFVDSTQEKPKGIQRRALPISVIAEEREVLNSNGTGTFSSEGGSAAKKRAFFDESLTTTELQSLESTKQPIRQPGEPIKSPIHYLNSPPPGLTPTRYQTKTYGTDVIK